MPVPRANAQMEVKIFGRARLSRAAPIYALHRSARQSLALPGRSSRPSVAAFTLIELIVVILIIAVLMGLAFPAFQGLQNQAKRAQARNDLVQIVTAVNAFYAEYGRYPLADLRHDLRPRRHLECCALQRIAGHARADTKSATNSLHLAAGGKGSSQTAFRHRNQHRRRPIFRSLGRGLPR